MYERWHTFVVKLETVSGSFPYVRADAWVNGSRVIDNMWMNEQTRVDRLASMNFIGRTSYYSDSGAGFDGDIAHLLTFNYALNSTELNNVINWAEARRPSNTKRLV